MTTEPGGAIGISPLLPEHWPAVRRIYLEGIATRQATFETEAPEWEGWDAAHHPFARLVAVREEEVVGWAALAPTSTRPAYAGVAEVSVYVAAAERGRGTGSRLFGALVDASESRGIWTLQAAVFPENAASVALHRRHGFRVVGRRERIARLDGRWRDVLLLERRSRRVGAD
jgi:L-amino acid N-acyltransferase YncA